MKILFISNGYGEDYVAVNIAKKLKILDTNLEIYGMPIVGEGYLYKKYNIPLIGLHKKLPSGGFLSNIKIILKDLKSGLIGLHLHLLKTLKKWSLEGDYIVSVGDIVPLIYAILSKKPFFFVSIQKSAYYVIDDKIDIENLTYKDLKSLAIKTFLGEYFFLKNPRLIKVFPRDSLTHNILKKIGVNSNYLGNPMMDGLETTGKLPLEKFQKYYKILILPGSKTPEAYNNFSIILKGISELIKKNPSEFFLFLTALSPNIDIEEIQKILEKNGFKKLMIEEDYILFAKNHNYLFLTNLFNDCIHLADLGICMAGTATEQFVGLGKPAIAIFGKGPQFTKKFALAQKRLLGKSLFLAEIPEEIPQIFQEIYKNDKLLNEISINGKNRMGNPGASYRIAKEILEHIQGGELWKK